MSDRDKRHAFSPPYLFFPEDSHYGFTHLLESHSAEIELAGIAKTEKIAPLVRQRRSLAGAARLALKLEPLAAQHSPERHQFSMNRYFPEQAIRFRYVDIIAKTPKATVAKGRAIIETQAVNSASLKHGRVQADA